VRVPLRQGDLDGLCGLYALVNAAVYLTAKAGKRMSRRDRLELFKRLAIRLFDHLDNRRRRRKGKGAGSPAIGFLWAGTSIKELPPMLDELQAFVEEKTGVKLVRLQPLLRNHRPRTLDQFWMRLREHLQGSEGKAVAIVGYNWRTDGREEGHWTCVKAMTDRQMVRVDSVGGKVLRRSRVTMRPPTRSRPYRVALHDVYLLAVQD
jgi:hypothetical protein